MSFFMTVKKRYITRTTYTYSFVVPYRVGVSMTYLDVTHGSWMSNGALLAETSSFSSSLWHGIQQSVASYLPRWRMIFSQFGSWIIVGSIFRHGHGYCPRYTVEMEVSTAVKDYPNVPLRFSFTVSSLRFFPQIVFHGFRATSPSQRHKMHRIPEIYKIAPQLVEEQRRLLFFESSLSLSPLFPLEVLDDHHHHHHGLFQYSRWHACLPRS